MRRSAEVERGGGRSEVLGCACGGDDGGADGEELDDVAAPAMVVLAQLDADDAFGLELLSFGLHTAHGELAGVVEGLGEVRQLDVATDLAEGLQHAAMRDVIDAGAYDHADRPMAGA